MGFPWGVDSCALAQGSNAVINDAILNEGGRGANMASGLTLGRGLRNALRDDYVVI